MDDILFDELAPILNYFPIKIGKADLSYHAKHNSFCLMYDNLQWMCLNCNDFREIKQFFVEINLACGNVVTTGLGMGLLQCHLILKKNVNRIIVYEKHPEVIEMFKITAEKNKFKLDKIEFRNEDASNLKNIECDWLLLDHFEAVHQPVWEILDDVRKISENNKANNIWFWSILATYRNFCVMKKLKLDSVSYSMFSKKLKVKNLIENIDKVLIEKISLIPRN